MNTFLKQLLQIFISGSIADYQRFYENNADEVNGLGKAK